MLKFINATPEHRGDAIYIAPQFIIAVYEKSAEQGGSLQTKIYGGPMGVVWTVEEGLSDVLKKISNAGY